MLILHAFHQFPVLRYVRMRPSLNPPSTQLDYLNCSKHSLTLLLEAELSAHPYNYLTLSIYLCCYKLNIVLLHIISSVVIVIILTLQIYMILLKAWFIYFLGQHLHLPSVLFNYFRNITSEGLVITDIIFHFPLK